MKAKSLSILALILFALPLFGQGDQSKIYQGNIGTTARDITFQYKAYEVILNNEDATNEYYAIVSSSLPLVTITSAMIATAADRETNNVVPVRKGYAISLDTQAVGISIIAASGETADYEIIALMDRRLRRYS